MTEPIDFFSWKVADLKRFLLERGVSCSFSRKFGLVKLCELAVELTLEVIPTDDEGDYKVMDIKRRTVEENGVNVIIPSPTDDITWYKRLTSLPDIQTCDILVFFMTYCKWDSHRLQSYKNDNGFRLFSSNHIEHVQISETFQNNYLYIKSDCIPETRQTSDPYKTWCQHISQDKLCLEVVPVLRKFYV